MTTQSAAPSPHLPVRPEWLALHNEPILEPDLAIIDPHHHLWDRPENRYLLDDVLADTGAGHKVFATVFMECGAMYRSDGPAAMAPLGETEFVNRIAEASAAGPCRIAEGIVGHADLLAGDAAGAVLDAHLQLAPARFKGIRQSSVYHADPQARASLATPPPGMLLDTQFRRGFACLAARGLSFDAWMYHTQLGELADLADAFPATTMVLNHVGGPLGIGPYAGRRAEVFGEWKAAIRDLARRDNVVVKLGGLGMRMFGFDFAARDVPPDSQALVRAWGPYVAECIDAFGPARAMFESNFPVDKGTCSYAVMWNAFKRMAASFGADEKNALFRDTAARVYRLSVAGREAAR